MREGTKQQGYTIVEVMIFLAVSGFMFIFAAVFINGKQARVEFKQGMNNINSQARAVVDDVNNGTYGQNNLTCNAANVPNSSPSSPAPIVGSTPNKDCVYIGKVIQFWPGDSGDDDSNYAIYTVIGREYKYSSTDGTLSGSLADAVPTPLTSDVEKHKFEGGIKVTKVCSGTCGSAGDLNGVGFFSSFPSGSANNLNSGSQGTLVVPITGNLNATSTQMTTDIRSSATDARISANPNITVCFDGGAGQAGALTIGGGSGQRLTTSIKISDDATKLGC
jgi:type II secretory pathway pseudopilin PulG